MNRKLVLAVAMALCVLGAAFGEMTRAELQALYTGYLRSEGYTPEVDKDGDVGFRYEGGYYYILVDETDPECFQLAYYDFWEIESEDELWYAYRAATIVTRDFKVVKCWVNSDESDVSISCEIYVTQPADFKPHFRRMLRAIQSARQAFIKEM